VRKLLIPVALLCALPAAWLLHGVYLAEPANVTITARKLTIRDSGEPRKPFRFDTELQFSNYPNWTQPVAATHFEEALMFFDDHAPGRTLPRKDLPNGRATLGWSLAGFSAFFLFFAYVLRTGPNCSWAFRPQRTFALVGLLPLIGGYLLLNHVQERKTWLKIQAEVITVPLLTLLDQRAPDLQIEPNLRKQLRTADLETIRYTHQNRQFLYPYGADVAMPTPRTEKQLDPANPAVLANFDSLSDGKALAAWLMLASGVLFLGLGLFVP
jgi:hypothetical protein